VLNAARGAAAERKGARVNGAQPCDLASVESPSRSEEVISGDRIK
jgi:hypothetical protein